MVPEYKVSGEVNTSKFADVTLVFAVQDCRGGTGLCCSLITDNFILYEGKVPEYTVSVDVTLAYAVLLWRKP